MSHIKFIAFRMQHNHGSLLRRFSVSQAALDLATAIDFPIELVFDDHEDMLRQRGVVPGKGESIETTWHSATAEGGLEITLVVTTDLKYGHANAMLASEIGLSDVTTY
jgi:hypothetical protein